MAVQKVNETEARINTGLSSATDAYLFALMAQRSIQAKAAWTEIYLRHVKDLRRLVHRLRGLAPADVDDLVQKTMMQAWKAAHTFQVDETLDEEAACNRTLAWLGQIAKNIYLSIYRQPGVEVVSEAIEGDDRTEYSPQSSGRVLIPPGMLYHEIRAAENQVGGVKDSNEGNTSTFMQLLLDALDSLPERERDILIETYEYRVRGQEQSPLPKAVITKLCQAYNINPAYLRKIRQRAYENVEQYIQSRRTEKASKEL